MQPTQMRDTSRPVRPSLVYFMIPPQRRVSWVRERTYATRRHRREACVLQRVLLRLGRAPEPEHRTVGVGGVAEREPEVGLLDVGDHRAAVLLHRDECSRDIG